MSSFKKLIESPGLKNIFISIFVMMIIVSTGSSGYHFIEGDAEDESQNLIRSTNYHDNS
ncbi:MAG: hypothetical protein ABJR05_03400 [Balneola sp.]